MAGNDISGSGDGGIGEYISGARRARAGTGTGAVRARGIGGGIIARVAVRHLRRSIRESGMHEVWFWLHAGSAWLSVTGFVLRGIWMLTDSPLRRRKPARILPHVVDTVLLVSAAGLALTLGQYPFAEGWLTAKLVALLVYIGLGLVAFRFGPTQPIRNLAFAGALLAGVYIMAVAYTKTPLPL